MIHKLENIVVIGSSCDGKRAVEYLMPRVDLASSVALIVPHIDNKQIYDSLKEQEVNVEGVEDGTRFEPNKAYVLGYDRQDLIMFGKKVDFENGSIRLYDTEQMCSSGKWSINHIMERIAEKYGKRSIGVILRGTGDDGARGLKVIKQFGGKALVQFEEQRRNIKREGVWQLCTNEMSKNALKMVKPDYVGPLPSLIEKLNGYLVNTR
ncbi:MAG: chemotaxis protein CheB [Candidatus Woesearchaeota archaeon]|jgi:two-component system CheB/CheR fusion protein|nr:chemotaxis protein CheB [Candidatus Woesearchaeota archaeon]MDP7506318.1 chemotaxis protein CheB [Candidatus Woesearchaeota archaeon]HJN62561.1 chemotaxis protein CheB [Candidatus Parcubacteria bacterium]|tara:strand:+ start:607 stop:1230 length:624 start_codon:yes stop_codon:yes gene_type:complete